MAARYVASSHGQAVLKSIADSQIHRGTFVSVLFFQHVHYIIYRVSVSGFILCYASSSKQAPHHCRHNDAGHSIVTSLKTATHRIPGYKLPFHCQHMMVSCLASAAVMTVQEKPLGHSNCLKGKTFVITGTLDSLYRNEAEDYIKRHSGRVTGSVSGKTTFLLVGENSGNSKVNQVSVS